MSEIFEIDCSDRTLKVRHQKSTNNEKRGVQVLFGGFVADQLSNDKHGRASVLSNAALENGFDFVSFNFMAHGFQAETRSGGQFDEISITELIRDAVSVCRSIETDNFSIVASSIGAGIAPFVVKELSKDRDINIQGMFGMSAVPPQALELFIRGLLSEGQKANFQAGEVVELDSPTLPIKIPVKNTQLLDLSNYSSYPDVGSYVENIKLKFLFGEHDLASNEGLNLSLVQVFGGGAEHVKQLDCGHDIPHANMLEEYIKWISEL